MMNTLSALSKISFFLISSFLISCFLIKVFLRTPLTNVFIDRPDSRKVHSSPLPRLGGIAIIISFVTMTFIWFFLKHTSIFYSVFPYKIIFPVIISSVIICLFGFLDDSHYVSVRARHKIAAELIISISTVYIFGVHSGPLSILGLFTFPLWFSKIISALWILGIINAFNIIDGVDGLAGGISLISILTLSSISAIASDTSIVLLGIILSGSIIGFLFHNSPPAKVFLGDTGSLFLGSMISLFSLYIAGKISGPRSVIIMPLIAGIPIIEVLVTMTRRYFKAKDQKKPFYTRIRSMAIPDNSHIHHRLIFRGFNHLETSSILCIIGGNLCIGAICIQLVPVYAIAPIVLYLLIPIIFALDRLGFGGRFKKALHLSKTRYNGFRKISVIGVVDQNGYLPLALNKQKNKNGMVFIPLSENNLYVKNNLKAAVIKNLKEESLDTHKAEEIALIINAPVYLIGNNQGSKYKIKEIKKNGTTIIKDKFKTINELVQEIQYLSDDYYQKVYVCDNKQNKTGIFHGS